MRGVLSGVIALHLIARTTVGGADIEILEFFRLGLDPKGEADEAPRGGRSSFDELARDFKFDRPVVEGSAFDNGDRIVAIPRNLIQLDGRLSFKLDNFRVGVDQVKIARLCDADGLRGGADRGCGEQGFQHENRESNWISTPLPENGAFFIEVLFALERRLTGAEHFHQEHVDDNAHEGRSEERDQLRESRIH